MVNLIERHLLTLFTALLLTTQLLWSAASFAEDIQPPTVSITNPTGGTVSGNVQVGVSASDDTNVAKVMLYLDGIHQIGIDYLAPYSFTWDTSTYANGNANLIAIAIDDAGNANANNVYVTVDNQTADVQPPTVSITNPTGGSVSGNVQVNVSASDDTNVDRVMLYLDGIHQIGVDYSAPYSFTWDTSIESTGDASLLAVAVDVAGNSSAHNVTVKIDNQGPDVDSPIVTITEPGNSATVSGNVIITAEATDNNGLGMVMLTVDGAWVGTYTNAPYSFNWNSATHANGATTITATAYDLAGNSSSYSIDVTVDNQPNGTNSPETGFLCYGCDDTNTKEKETIDKYNNAEGLYKALSLRRIPWLENDYIPQGIHVTDDGLVYISMYHKNKDGVSSKSSVVIKYSTATNEVIDVYFLKNSDDSQYKGHVGGLVVSGDYLIVPYGNKLDFFKLSDATPSASGLYSKIKLAFKTGMDFGGSEYNYKISFINTTKDHLNQDILWTGQFETSNTIGSHILGYKIKSDGTVNSTPIYRFYVPESVNKLQGVTVLEASHDTYTLLLSQSYGSSTSYLYKVYYDRQESLAYKYDFNSNSIVFNGPAGLEDLHASADGIWSLSESGANYFQNRASNPWNQLFPFIIKLRKSDMY